MRLALCMVFCCFLAGCASMQQCPEAAELPAQAWKGSNRTFTLRHGGVLKMDDKALQLTGIIRLDTKVNRADVAIFNPFGIKLVVLRVTPESTEVLQSSLLAERIPHFADQAGAVIRTLFLNAEDTAGCAVIQYQGTRQVDTFFFPETTTFTEQQKGYTVILRLKEGQVHDEAH